MHELCRERGERVILVAKDMLPGSKWQGLCVKKSDTLSDD